LLLNKALLRYESAYLIVFMNYNFILLLDRLLLSLRKKAGLGLMYNYLLSKQVE